MKAIDRTGRLAERAGRAADAFQQRHPALAFPVAVWAAEVDVVLAKKLWPPSVLPAAASDPAAEPASAAAGVSGADAGAARAGAPRVDVPAGAGGAAGQREPAAPAPRTPGDNGVPGGKSPADDARLASDGRAGKVS